MPVPNRTTLHTNLAGLISIIYSKSFSDNVPRHLARDRGAVHWAAMCWLAHVVAIRAPGTPLSDTTYHISCYDTLHTTLGYKMNIARLATFHNHISDREALVLGLVGFNTVQVQTHIPKTNVGLADCVLAEAIACIQHWRGYLVCAPLCIGCAGPAAAEAPLAGVGRPRALSSPQCQQECFLPACVHMRGLDTIKTCSRTDTSIMQERHSLQCKFHARIPSYNQVSEAGSIASGPLTPNVLTTRNALIIVLQDSICVWIR